MELPVLGRSRSGVGVGVIVNIFRPELESKSLEIRRLVSLAMTFVKILYLYDGWVFLRMHALGNI